MIRGSRQFIKLLLLALVIVLVAGCNKYFRLAELGAQFCFYEDNFNLVNAGGIPHLTMIDPVMRDSDIKSLFNVAPTHQRFNGEVKEAVYLFRSVTDERDRTHQFTLSYTRDDNDDWRLSGGTGDPYVAKIVPITLLEQSFRSICSWDTSYSLQEIEFDLALIEKDLIPRWEAIREIIGPPKEIELYADGAVRYRVHYEMQLINPRDHTGKLFIDLFFNENGQLVRNAIKVKRLAFEANFDENRAFLKLI